MNSTGAPAARQLRELGRRRTLPGHPQRDARGRGGLDRRVDALLRREPGGHQRVAARIRAAVLRERLRGEVVRQDVDPVRRHAEQRGLSGRIAARHQEAIDRVEHARLVQRERRGVGSGLRQRAAAVQDEARERVAVVAAKARRRRRERPRRSRRRAAGCAGAAPRRRPPSGPPRGHADRAAAACCARAPRRPSARGRRPPRRPRRGRRAAARAPPAGARGRPSGAPAGRAPHRPGAGPRAGARRSAPRLLRSGSGCGRRGRACGGATLSSRWTCRR